MQQLHAGARRRGPTFTGLVNAYYNTCTKRKQSRTKSDFHKVINSADASVQLGSPPELTARPDREAIRSAADTLDRLLSVDAQIRGESRYDSFRVWRFARHGNDSL